MELERRLAALEQVDITEDIEVPNTESQVRKLQQEITALTHQLQRMTTAIPGEIDKRIRSAAQLPSSSSGLPAYASGSGWSRLSGSRWTVRAIR